jgi:adenylate cyclase
METTDVEGRIQVPQNVYERLNHAFVLEERGTVDVKGKGVMHTWYLVARRDDDAVRRAVEQDAGISRSTLTPEAYPPRRK